jgi:hypothetical protein
LFGAPDKVKAIQKPTPEAMEEDDAKAQAIKVSPNKFFILRLLLNTVHCA